MDQGDVGAFARVMAHEGGADSPVAAGAAAGRRVHAGGRPLAFPSASTHAVGCLGASPELSGGETRALRQGGELQPCDARVGVVETHAGGGKAAVGAGDDALAPDDLREADDPL